MKNILTIIKKELARVFKDPRLVFSSIFLPGIMIFAIYYFMGLAMPNLIEGQSDYVPKIYVQNAQPNFKETLEVIYKQQSKDDINTLAKYVEISENDDITAIIEDIKNEKVDVLVVFALTEEQTVNNEPIYQVQIYANSNKSESTTAANLCASAASSLNLPTSAYWVSQIDTVPIGQMGASILGALLPLLLVMFLFSGTVSVTPESIAGEKERGSLGTILVTPIKRSELAIGKIISLSILAICSALSSFIGTIASLPSMFGDMDVSYSITQYLYILLILISTIFIMVSLLSCVSAFAKTVKEANSFVVPIMLLSTMLGVTSMFINPSGMPIGVYFIPLFNTIVALNGIFTFHISILGIVITTIFNVIYAVGLSYLLVRLFNSEKVMFAR